MHAAPEVRSSLEPIGFTLDSLSSPLRQIPTPQTSNKRTPLKTTPSARLRHDDSQIQFAAIESSPIGQNLLDSQLLTDRQREVKERQQVETAAMFPDLRSSPRLKLREAHKDLPRICFVSDPASTGDLVADGPTTPTLPLPQHGPMDDFLSSSPTPRSRNREQLVGSPDIGPPSSPPDFRFIAADGQLAERPSSPLSSFAQNGVDVSDFGERPESPAMEELDDRNGNLDLRGHEPATEFDHARKLSLSADSMKEVETVTPIIGEMVSGMLDVHYPSDFDTFVDTPSTPIPSSAVQAADVSTDKKNVSPASETRNMEKQGRILGNAAEEILTNSQPTGSSPARGPTKSFFSLEDNISRVLNSFGEDGAEQPSSNDGQVSSQLKKDLSKAVGKDCTARGEVNPDTTATVVPDGIKKRKRKTADATLPLKKSKVFSCQSNIQVVIEVPRRDTPDADDDDMLDCIVVDSSPATARPHMSLSGVKLEQTPSPSKSARVYIASKVQKRPVGRPRKRAAEGDTLPSDKMTPPRSKKRKASESLTQHEDCASASMTSTPVHKKRRSSRLSQASAPSSSQRSNNSKAQAEEAGAVSVAVSNTTALNYDDTFIGGQNQSKATKNNAPSDLGDGDHTQMSQPQSISFERPAAVEEDSHIVKSAGAENEQDSADRDETLSDFRAEAHTTAAAAKNSQVTGGLASELHRGQGGEDTSMAEESSNLVADTTRPSQDTPEVQFWPAQTRLLPGGSQPGSPNGRRILGGLKRILKDIQRVVLGAQEEREIDDVLFDIRKEVHEAGRRGIS